MEKAKAAAAAQDGAATDGAAQEGTAPAAEPGRPLTMQEMMQKAKEQVQKDEAATRQ